MSSLVRDSMTYNPVCVDSNDLVTKARSLFRKHGFRALPVLDDGRLTGIITRGDILGVTATKSNVEVKGFMNTAVVSTSPDESIYDAAKRMVDSGVRQLVVSENGSLLGIISSMDVLRALSEVHVPDGISVSEIMSRDIVSCSPDDTVSSILDEMDSSGYGGLPVVSKNRVVGMVTRMDLIQHRSARSGKTSVDRLMKKPAVSVNPETTIETATQVLLQNKILRMPVVDSKGNIEGIVDVLDMLSAYV